MLLENDCSYYPYGLIIHPTVDIGKKLKKCILFRLICTSPYAIHLSHDGLRSDERFAAGSLGASSGRVIHRI
jgi:hypothetical protein